MAELAVGLATFTLGKGIDIVGTTFDKILGFFTGEKSFADRIYNQVSKLLSILDLPAVKNQSFAGMGFAGAMAEIAAGIAAFTAIKGIDALAGIGTAIIKFFTGEDGAISELLKLANKADDLLKVGNALEKISIALSGLVNTFQSAGRTDLSNFARQLAYVAEGIPAMAFGGEWDPPGPGDYDFGPKGKGGILNPDIPYDELEEKVRQIQKIFSPIPQTRVIYQQAPQTGNVMNQMISEFNQRQSQPNYVMIGGNNGTTSIQRGGDTVMLGSPSSTDSRVRALGEASPK